MNVFIGLEELIFYFDWAEISSIAIKLLYFDHDRTTFAWRETKFMQNYLVWSIEIDRDWTNLVSVENAPLPAP